MDGSAARRPRAGELVETGVPCRMSGCGGSIVERYEQRFNASRGPKIIGPGSRGQYYVALGSRHCSSCGVQYAFLNPRKTKESE